MAPSTAPGTQHVAPGTDTTPPAIVVDTLVKRFGTFTAVNGVSFAVADGEIFGLLGPNGAGKSTLIRMLTTLLPPTSGTARVFGHDVAKEPDEVRQSIGVIPQAMTSDLELSVEENLLIYAKLYSVPPAKRSTADRGAAGRRRADRVGRQAGEVPVRRHAAARRDRARPRARAARLLPRRTDHRPRSGLARRGLGDAPAHQERTQPDGPRSRRTTWTKPTSSAIGLPSSITASSRRSTRR